MVHDPNRVWYFSVTITSGDRVKVIDGTATEAGNRTRRDLVNAIRDGLGLGRNEGMAVNHLEANEL